MSSGSFRSECEYKIEYKIEYTFDFSNLVCMLKFIMCHTGLVPRASFSTDNQQQGEARTSVDMNDLIGLKSFSYSILYWYSDLKVTIVSLYPGESMVTSKLLGKPTKMRGGGGG